jgi:hypothetical protein
MHQSHSELKQRKGHEAISELLIDQVVSRFMPRCVHGDMKVTAMGGLLFAACNICGKCCITPLELVSDAELLAILHKVEDNLRLA